MKSRASCPPLNRATRTPPSSSGRWSTTNHRFRLFGQAGAGLSQKPGTVIGPYNTLLSAPVSTNDELIAAITAANSAGGAVSSVSLSNVSLISNAAYGGSGGAGGNRGAGGNGGYAAGGAVDVSAASSVSLIGIPLFESTYDGNGNLTSVTIFGINITFLFELTA